MSKRMSPKKARAEEAQLGITRLTVSSFKSFRDEQAIEIRPLTILAGANSSGKSTMLQPLLLLKQTLEATYDPGALKLDGPNVKFTSTEQLLSRFQSGKHANKFSVGIQVNFGWSKAGTTFPEKNRIMIRFKQQPRKGFDVQEMIYAVEYTAADFATGRDEPQPVQIRLRPHMPAQEFVEILDDLSELAQTSPIKADITPSRPLEPVFRDRCFLYAQAANTVDGQTYLNVYSLADYFVPFIEGVIHVPGLRGNPERNYPIAGVGPTFAGPFPPYVASVIAQWQEEKDKPRLELLRQHLTQLGLTNRIVIKRIDATQFEIRVGRAPSRTKGNGDDLVSIADVGFGLSQTLPVLVALLAARSGQLVYIEQPEIHLHPRAQYEMAGVLADAAKRGVRVVAETHSALLLLGVQSLVAEGKLAPELVKLHWFARRPDGSTQVREADLDETGAFGDWPEDFAEVALEAESRYLNAAGSHYRQNGHGRNGHAE